MDYTVKNYVMDRTDKNVTASTSPSGDRPADADPPPGAPEEPGGPRTTRPRHHPARPRAAATPGAARTAAAPHAPRTASHDLDR